MKILGIIIVLIGIWPAISPKSALATKSRLARDVGAKLTFSKKTEKIARVGGIVLVIIGLYLFFPY